MAGPVVGSYVSSKGEFTRDQNYIATRITADGRDGYPVEPGRYRLIVSRGMPMGEQVDHRAAPAGTRRRTFHGDSWTHP